MTRVDFYVVKEAGEDARLRVAARLADKAVQQGHRVFIHTDTEAQARTLDQTLWSFRDHSFLPHALASDDLDETVLIGWGQTPERHDDVLINLSLDIAPFFSRFQRLAEVVTQDEASLASLREAWRYYRDRGYPLHKHDL
jgi:DNA polymerase-3 subunit chi